MARTYKQLYEAAIEQRRRMIVEGGPRAKDEVFKCTPEERRMLPQWGSICGLPIVVEEEQQSPPGLAHRIAEALTFPLIVLITMVVCYVLAPDSRKADAETRESSQKQQQDDYGRNHMLDRLDRR